SGQGRDALGSRFRRRPRAVVRLEYAWRRRRRACGGDDPRRTIWYSRLCFCGPSLELHCGSGGILAFAPGRGGWGNEIQGRTPNSDSEFEVRPWISKRILMAAFLSGACLLALEVVWFRFLSMFVVTGTLAFALMLSVVLAGIGIGSLAASRWLKSRPDAVRHLPLIAFAAGISLILTYWAFQIGS